MTKKKTKPKKAPKQPKPPKKKDIVAVGKGQQCRARVKTCTNKECQYRFAGGDKSWHCPECGTYRRCKAKAVYPYTVCRMHGAGGGRPPTHGKFIPPQQIAEAYNAVYDDPSLLSLAFNIALSEARTNDLLAMLDDLDIRAAAGEIATGLNELLRNIQNAEEKLNENGVSTMETRAMIAQAKFIVEALSPAVQTQRIWRQVNEQLEITRRLNDTERKWIDQHDAMVPLSTVLESLAIVIRLALKFIPNSQDRSKFAKQMRALMPSVK